MSVRKAFLSSDLFHILHIWHVTFYLLTMELAIIIDQRILTFTVWVFTVCDLDLWPYGWPDLEWCLLSYDLNIWSVILISYLQSWQVTSPQTFNLVIRLWPWQVPCDSDFQPTWPQHLMFNLDILLSNEPWHKNVSLKIWPWHLTNDNGIWPLPLTLNCYRATTTLPC